MENKTNNQVSDFIKTEVLKIESRSFVVRILGVLIGYAGITLWLNSIRATAPLWFVWVLIVIQFALYFSIFVFSYQRSKVCGLNKSLGIVLFITLAALGRVNDWELLIIPLLVVIMIVFSVRTKNIPESLPPEREPSHTEKDGSWIVPLEDFLEKTKNEFESAKLPIPIGVDKNGYYVMGDLRKLGHILIAGSTGSGKSTFNHVTIHTLTKKYSPEELQFFLADPKIVEFQSLYQNLPHLFSEVEVESNKILTVLEKLAEEKNNRLQENKKKPYLVVIIDTFSDVGLQDMASFERYVQDITENGVKAGVHMIICDSRPSKDLYTEKIKKCFPTKIAFNTASSVDSEVIIGQKGAERLLGRGDMLFLGPNQKEPTRLQAPWISDEKIENAND